MLKLVDRKDESRHNKLLLIATFTDDARLQLFICHLIARFLAESNYYCSWIFSFSIRLTLSLQWKYWFQIIFFRKIINILPKLYWFWLVACIFTIKYRKSIFEQISSETKFLTGRSLGPPLVYPRRALRKSIFSYLSFVKQ